MTPRSLVSELITSALHVGAGNEEGKKAESEGPRSEG